MPRVHGWRKRGTAKKESREKTCVGPQSSISYDFLRFYSKTTLFDDLTPSLSLSLLISISIQLSSPSLLSLVSRHFPSHSLPTYSNNGKQVYASLVYLPLCHEFMYFGGNRVSETGQLLATTGFFFFFFAATLRTLLFSKWSVTVCQGMEPAAMTFQTILTTLPGLCAHNSASSSQCSCLFFPPVSS